MKNSILMALFGVLCLFYGSVVWAQPTQIDRLQWDLARQQAVLDSVMIVRLRLERDVVVLAGVVDSLKRGQGNEKAEGMLEKTLQKSLAVALALEDCYRQEEDGRNKVLVVKEQLRDGLDREIGLLVQDLSVSTDSSKVVYLRQLQQLRGRLVQTQRGSELARPIPKLGVRADDGPEAIRQKAELMGDVALQIRDDVKTTERRLKKLEEERRLRGRVASFSNELFLFDESLPEGRSVAVGGADAGTPPNPDQGLAGLVGPPVDKTEGGRLPESGTSLIPESPSSDFVLGREVSVSEPRVVSGGGDGDVLAVEIRRLEQQRAALLAREKQVDARVRLLRQYLEALLGDSP